jgi:hypothetical protein
MFFGSMFVLTAAWLAQHQTLRDKNPFWRRATAAAQAGLILRACGSDNEEKAFEWAMNHSGKPFVFSVYLEGTSEPRWRVDWLTGISEASRSTSPGQASRRTTPIRSVQRALPC